MRLLHEKLQQSNVVAISAITGMGGVGKTELATQYARRYETDYSGGICWLNARDTNLAAEIIKFYQFYVDNQREIPQEIRGRVLTVAEQAIWCWDNWQPPEGLILVIWDDVTDLASCQELLPTNNRFRLLITTRLRNLDPNIVEEIILDVLPPDQSIELLSALVGKKRIKRKIEIANELCKLLGYLPLGLDLVGRYIADDPDLSLQAMLERLKQQQLDDEALERSNESWTAAQRGVKAAFELSWRKLDAITQRVAELLGLFALDVIPWILVESISKRLDWNKTDINKAKKQLYKQHLIQKLEDGESHYKIHPLIHQFLQGKLELTTSVDGFKQAFVDEMVLVSRQIPEDPTYQLITTISPAIPHVAEVAKSLTAYLSDEDLIVPFVHLGRFYEGQGLYSEAEEIYKLSRIKVEKRFVSEHPYLATSLSHLGSIYHTQERYTEAEPLHQKALQIRRKLLGEEHVDVADSLNHLALLFTDQGKYVEAENFCQQALEMRQKLLGEKHLDLTDSLNNLAYLYYEQKLYEKAKPLFIKALQLRQELLDEEHPRIATSLSNLASCYYYLGLDEEAKTLYLQALELSRKILGEKHRDVAKILSSLAQVYAYQQEYQQAEPFFLEALKQQKQIFGEEHLEVANGLNNLASLYEDIGNVGEVEPLYKQSLEIRKRLLGDSHLHVAISLNNLAKFYSYQNRYTEAEALYIESIDIIDLQLGANHPLTVKVRSNLEELRLKMKNNQDNI